MSQDDYHSQFKQYFSSWFPHHQHLAPTVAEEPTFEIALVIAGAVSGGAYAAGAIDFLFEALDEWEIAKADWQQRGLEEDSPGTPVPDHRVKLSIIAGASAGSILAAQIALAARYDWRKMKNEPSPFYQTWVKDCSIRDAFESNELRQMLSQGKGGIADVQSLLSSEFMLSSATQLLRRFVDAKIEGEIPYVERGWLAEGFNISMQVNNLRGISYQTTFSGLGGSHGGAAGIDPFLMRVHEDRFDFRYLGTGDRDVPLCPAVKGLDADAGPSTADLAQLGRSLENDGSWKILIQAAMASSAFPVGLPPVVIKRPMWDYYWRYYRVDPLGSGEYKWNFAQPCESGYAASDYVSALYTDGGTLINEPYVYAQEFLAGFAGELSHDKDTKQAILMIDPFPQAPKRGPSKLVGILQLLPKLVDSWKNNARSDSRGLANKIETSYSRFLLRPTRVGDDMREVDLELASGPLGGYFGLFAEQLREHDYRLGRLNAQKFLRDQFTLPADSALFRHTSFFQSRQDHAHRFESRSSGNKEYQIIPLCGSARTMLWDKQNPDPGSTPVWPDHQVIREKMNECKTLVMDRLQLIIKLSYRGGLRSLWSAAEASLFRDINNWSKLSSWKKLGGGVGPMLYLVLLKNITYPVAIWRLKIKLASILNDACRELEINRTEQTWKNSPEYRKRRSQADEDNADL